MTWTKYLREKLRTAWYVVSHIAETRKPETVCISVQNVRDQKSDLFCGIFEMYPISFSAEISAHVVRSGNELLTQWTFNPTCRANKVLRETNISFPRRSKIHKSLFPGKVLTRVYCAKKGWNERPTAHTNASNKSEQATKAITCPSIETSSSLSQT